MIEIFQLLMFGVIICDKKGVYSQNDNGSMWFVLIVYSLLLIVSLYGYIFCKIKLKQKDGKRL